MAYYFVLSKHPSKSYVLSVTIAIILGSFLTFLSMFRVVFGSIDTKITFPFESLLLDGLSHEKWLTANAVRNRTRKVRTILRREEDIPEELYFLLLLILSFSGLIEYRPETPEQRSDAIIGKLLQEGEVLTAYTYQVDQEEAEIFTSIKQKRTNTIKNDHYRDATLSRLVYDGVRIVFQRKKLGPKRPARTNAFMQAFGISTN